MSESTNDATREASDSAKRGAKGAVKAGQLLNKGLRASGALKKAVVFLFNKIILALGKALLAFFGWIGCLFIIIAVILLLLITALPLSDWFLKSGERNAAEVYYDEALTEAIELNHRHMIDPIRGAFTFKGTGNLDGLKYSDVNESNWLYQLEEALIPSPAITSALVANKIANEKKPEWHKERVTAMDSNGKEQSFRPYTLVDSNGVISQKNKDLIDDFLRNRAFDYYFNHLGATDGVELKFTHQTVNDEIARTYVYDEQTGKETVSESTLAPREVVSNVRAVYKSLSVPMKRVTTPKTQTSRSCTTVTEGEGEDEKSVQYCKVTSIEYELWVVDTSQDPTSLVHIDTLELLKHLLLTAPEGDRTQLIHPRDLEFAWELMKSVDPDIPDVTTNFDGLTKCYEEQGDIQSCLMTIGGGFDMYFFGGGYCSGKFSEYINEASETFGVDAALISAIIDQESSWNPNAGSPKGAQGLMQLMPLIINYYGVSDPFNPRDNIMGGTQYLRDNLNLYKGDVDKALAAYNAGETAVNRWIREGTWPNIPFTETRKYVPSVKSLFDQYSAETCSPTEGEMVMAGGMACPMIHPALRLTSPFGMRNGRLHGGLDLGTGQIPTPIYAVKDGNVDRAGHRGSLGYHVTIRHGNVAGGRSLYTVYGHLQPGSITVRPGQTVKAGTMVGIMGGSGNQGTNRDYVPHLHFETHVGGEWGNFKVNPVSLGLNINPCIR